MHFSGLQYSMDSPMHPWSLQQLLCVVIRGGGGFPEANPLPMMCLHVHPYLVKAMLTYMYVHVY